MSYLPDLPVVDSASDSDYVIINQGRKSRQISKKNFLPASGGDTGGYAVEFKDASDDYVLEDTEANKVFITNTSPAANSVTIPDSAGIPIGTEFVYNNASESAVDVNVAAGVTVANLTDGSTQIFSSVAGDGGTFGFFVKTGATTWIAYGAFS